MSEELLLPLVRSGVFRVTESGEVWLQKVVSGPRRNLPRRAEHYTPCGYAMIRAMVNGKRVHALAHRLVWLVYRGSIPRGLCINHLNGNKRDNRIQNLQVVSYSENSKHAHASGLIDQRGEANPQAKISDSATARLRLEYAHGGIVTQQSLAERYRLSFQAVSKIVRGERRKSNLGPTANYVSRRFHSSKRNQKGQFTNE